MSKYFIPTEHRQGDSRNAWREVEAPDDQAALAQIKPELLHEGDRIELIRLDDQGHRLHLYHIVSVGPEGRWSLQRWKARDL
jgi:hypothetical protein